MSFHTKPNLYIREITINVSNLQQSLTFYTELLGFRILDQQERKAVLTVDGVNPIIVLNQPTGVTPKHNRTTGLYHFAILLPSRKDLGSFLLHLVKKQFRLQGASDHLVSEALYFSDPDGNGIEVYHDRPAVQWNWRNNQVEMTTEPMDAEGVISAGQGKEWIGMPKETIIGHIHLHVADLDKAITFYKEAFGYEVVCLYGGQAAFMSTGGYHHHLGLNTWNGTGASAPTENSVGMKEFSIAIPNEEYKQKIKRSLKALNISFSELDDSLKTSDPSSNHISLQVEGK